MLQERAMLANLTIRCWTARKLDRKVSEEVTLQHGAKDAGNFNKLLIDKVSLAPYVQHTGRVREYHYKMTLPWGDNGDRLLPSKAYFDYTTAMRTFRQNADKLADEFEREYPKQVANARARLGSMYNASDYPPVSDIRNRFSINISFLPVPDAEDFRVDVGTEAIEEIKASITNAVIERQVQAVKECWLRLYEVISKIESTLRKDKAIFRDSLITNASDLIELLPKLNINDDKDLNSICEDIKAKLIINPQKLRNNYQRRTEFAEIAASILQDIARHV